mmetsp:Transcript_1021/g.2001  ORF Transcript_1021/g.2001 Transcript_1021/m.2001 type:complete len:120 (+) Transcript_1021:113-472(+)
MSFGTARGVAPTAPDKGSFPLDHKAECQPSMRLFLDCLKENKSNHHKCKELSKSYLECRINRGLMAEENLDELGFKHNVSVDEEEVAKQEASRKEKKGFYGGLSGGRLTGDKSEPAEGQ